MLHHQFFIQMFSGLQVRSAGAPPGEEDPIELAKMMARNKKLQGGPKVVKKRKKRTKTPTKQTKTAAPSLGSPASRSEASQTPNTIENHLKPNKKPAKGSLFQNLQVKVKESLPTPTIPLEEPLPEKITQTSFSSSQNPPIEATEEEKTETPEISAQQTPQSLNDTENIEKTISSNDLVLQNTEEEERSQKEEEKAKNLNIPSSCLEIPFVIEELKQSIDKTFEEIEGEQEKAREQSLAILQEKSNFLVLSQSLAFQTKSLKKKQEEASKKEEFENATAIEEEITELQKKIKTNQNHIKTLEQSSEVSYQTVQSATSKKIEILRNKLQLLQTIEYTEKEKVSQRLEYLETEQTRQELRLEKEQARLQEEKVKFDKEEQHLKSIQSETAKQVEAQSAELLLEEKSWQSKENEVQAEIDQLLTLLESKEKERKNIRSQLASTREKIKENEKPFQLALRTHMINEQFLNEAREEIEVSERYIEEVAGCIEEFKKKSEKSRTDSASHSKLIADRKYEIEYGLLLLNSFQEKWEVFEEKEENGKIHLRSLLSALEENAKERAMTEQQLGDCCRDELDARKDIYGVQQRVRDSEIKMEQLCESKRVAIGARQYKEAGLHSALIKEQENAFLSLKEKEKGLLSTIELTSGAIEEYKAKLKVLEEKFGELSLQHLSKKEERLRWSKQNLELLIAEFCENSSPPSCCIISNELSSLHIRLKDVCFELDLIETGEGKEKAETGEQVVKTGERVQAGERVQDRERVVVDGEFLDEKSPLVREEKISEHFTSSDQWQQKVVLREQIAGLELQIMALVDNDLFDEADELENERVTLQSTLNALE